MLLALTSHCYSPHTAAHLTLPLTSHYHSPYTTTHLTLPLTSHYHSPHTTTHLTLPLTSHYHSPHTTTHLTLPVTSHCPSPHTTTHHTLSAIFAHTKTSEALASTYLMHSMQVEFWLECMHVHATCVCSCSGTCTGEQPGTRRTALNLAEQKQTTANTVLY